MTLSLILLTFIFVIGLVIGSFMNVVILRTVSEESIVFPGSKCPKCQTPLKWYHNIPVFSYLFLRGKCAFCKTPISIQYPIVELLTAFLFVALFIKYCSPFDALFGLSAINSISVYQLITYIFTLIVSCLFIAIAGTDFIEKKVADIHTYSLIGVGVLYSIYLSITNFVLYYKDLGMPKIDLSFFLSCPILHAIAAALVGFLIMEILSKIGELAIGTRAFGEGDSYIAAGLGAVFAALLRSSSLYQDFASVSLALVGILVLAAAIQILVTLPIFIKKLIQSKNWITLGALGAFVIYSVAFIFAQNAGWLSHQIALWLSIIVLVALGLFACREILANLKENNAATALYLPFGPAMVLAGFIVLLAIEL